MKTNCTCCWGVKGLEDIFWAETCIVFELTVGVSIVVTGAGFNPNIPIKKSFYLLYAIFIHSHIIYALWFFGLIFSLNLMEISYIIPII